MGKVIRTKHKTALTAQAAALAIVDHFVTKQKWYVLKMEGPMPKTHEGCKGPDCDCFNQEK